MDYVIRQMKEEEYPLLNDFLYEAIYIPDGVEPPPESIINSSELQEYIAGFGNSEHDQAIVADVRGKVVGVVWARIMNDYGHVDNDTPSLAMSVLKKYRGLGIGTALLKEMLLNLKSNGYSKVSLSVQKVNYAVNLYKKAGFTILHENEEEYIMVNTMREVANYMEIRQEKHGDHEEIYKVVKEAFAGTGQSDGNEQELVDALRNSPSFVPELSLVAAEDGKIVGHILFTKAYVGSHTVLALAPLSVLPAYQRRGIGLALIAEGHRIARELGHEYAVVLGHSGYYPKAGYVPACTYGIKAPFEVSDENFMAVKLMEGAGRLDGVIKYDEAFGIKSD